MLFGRRRRSSPSQHAIIEFWQWWPAARPRLAASVDAGERGSSLAAEITQRVAAIHPDLQWELGRGQVARHDFTLSPAGRADLRATAARWLALAPPADDTWEFHDSRQAVPTFSTLRLQIHGHELGVGETRFGVTRHNHSIDVAVFHPLFAELPDGQRTNIALLCLDWALGEQAVEIWVGEVEATPTAPGQADTVDGLRQAVADLAARHEEPHWLVLRGSTPKTQGKMAAAQAPLRPARWPRFDTHAALTLPYEDRGNGLPTDAALAALRDFEDSVTPMLGKDGDLLAYESGRGIRTLHYYVDGESSAPQRLADAVSGWPRARITTTLDPGLAAIRHLDVAR